MKPSQPKSAIQASDDSQRERQNKNTNEALPDKDSGPDSASHNEKNVLEEVRDTEAKQTPAIKSPVQVSDESQSEQEADDTASTDEIKLKRMKQLITFNSWLKHQPEPENEMPIPPIGGGREAVDAAFKSEASNSAGLQLPSERPTENLRDVLGVLYDSSDATVSDSEDLGPSTSNTPAQSDEENSSTVGSEIVKEFLVDSPPEDHPETKD